jgi:hypothetical protein
MEKVNNVVPLRPNQQVPSTVQEMNSQVAELKLHHCSEFLEYYLPKMFEEMSMAGFDFAKYEDSKGMVPAIVIKMESFLAEVLRSHVMACQGMDHPFQKIAEGLYKDGPNGIEIINEIYFDFSVSDQKPVKKKAKAKKKDINNDSSGPSPDSPVEPI